MTNHVRVSTCQDRRVTPDRTPTLTHWRGVPAPRQWQVGTAVSDRSGRDDDETERPPTTPARSLTDADVAAAVAGDEQAFAALYLDVQPRLRRYATSLVGGDADDVTAEAWLQITRDLRQFSGDLDAFRAWTARIVRNRAMDQMRSRARRPLDPVPVEDLPPLRAPDDPETAALDIMATADALALIATLPPGQAEAVLLQTVVGLDATSAASVLGKSPNAVRVSTHRGLRALARRLREEERKRR
jgi:RNA polymerase sigma-70 factor (ECF subfamily)